MAAMGAMQSAAVAQSVAAAMAPGVAAPVLPPVMPGHVGLPPPPSGASAFPTPFLCVTGMVTATVLMDDAEYKEVGVGGEGAEGGVGVGCCVQSGEPRRGGPRAGVKPPPLTLDRLPAR